MRRKKHKQRPSRVEFEKRCKCMIQDILNKIRSGEFAVGSFLPSEADFCQEYSLSRSSVRKVLEQLEKMVTLTRQQGKGIIVGNPDGDAVEEVKNKKVMVLLPFGYRYEALNFTPKSQIDTGNAIYALERELAAHNISCEFLYYKSRDEFNEKHALNAVLREDVNVLITVSNIGEKIKELTKQLSYHNIKVLTVFEPIPFADCSTITVNHFGIGQLAARHLIKQGHLNIACIVSNLNTKWENERVDGFISLCDSAGLSHCRDLVFRIDVPDRLIGDPDGIFHYTGVNGASQIRDQVVMEYPEITGIFCINDRVARGVYEFAQKNRIDIPGVWSVVGCDNEINYLDLNLTTISQEFFQCGQLVAELVNDYFNGKLKNVWPITYKVPPILLRRGSTIERAKAKV